MAATVITIAVEKGGCGKTVTTSNLAYLMGDEGKKVLCLDTDPQGNLTFALTGGNAITSKAFANRSLYDMIDGFRYNTQTRDFIVESEYENVDLIPANDQTPRFVPARWFSASFCGAGLPHCERFSARAAGALRPSPARICSG